MINNGKLYKIARYYDTENTCLIEDPNHRGNYFYIPTGTLVVVLNRLFIKYRNGFREKYLVLVQNKTGVVDKFRLQEINE